MKKIAVISSLILGFLTYFWWIGEYANFDNWSRDPGIGVVFLLEIFLFLLSILINIILIFCIYFLKKVKLIKQGTENKISFFILLITMYSGSFLLLKEIFYFNKFGIDFILHIFYRNIMSVFY